MAHPVVHFEIGCKDTALDFAKVKATETANKWLVASSSKMPVASGGHDDELIEASNAMTIATTRVKELTAPLNDMLGWPLDTELQLVPPDPGFEDISPEGSHRQSVGRQIPRWLRQSKT